MLELEPDFDTYKVIIEKQPNYFTLRKNLMQAEKEYERTLANIINDTDINKNMQIAEKEYEQKLSEGD